jgi:hypothetical protein
MKMTNVIVPQITRGPGSEHLGDGGGGGILRTKTEHGDAAGPDPISVVNHQCSFLRMQRLYTTVKNRTEHGDAAGPDTISVVILS